MSYIKNILIVFGTRPEAIKMAVLVHELKREPSFNVKVCVTAQHREMLDQVLEVFEITPDFDLNIMQSKQDLSDITSKVLLGIREVLRDSSYDIVLVHGDTTTSMATALAAFYKKVPVGHIEAGLRTNDKYSPWPEEINRQITARLATYHFAPTKVSKENLLKENISNDRIIVTGNTVIDSLNWISRKFETSMLDCEHTINNLVSYGISKPTLNNWIIGERRMVLITGHRRENFGIGLKNICEAINELANKYNDVDFVYPVHLNPNVRDALAKEFGRSYLEPSEGNTFFIEPLPYKPFVFLLKQSYLVLTDSGGIQEEAPGLSKPVLVMRETTERPEAVEAGTVKLIGTDKEKIVRELSLLLDDSAQYGRMSRAINPYGDGRASSRITGYLKDELNAN